MCTSYDLLCIKILRLPSIYILYILFVYVVGTAPYLIRDQIERYSELIVLNKQTEHKGNTVSLPRLNLCAMEMIRKQSRHVCSMGFLWEAEIGGVM